MRFRTRPGTGTLVGFIVGAVVATAGTATAGLIITGKQIKDGTVSSKDLSKEVRRQLAKKGATGPQGSQGPKGDAGPATGTAGGSLTGSYPNPGLADGTVGTSNFATIPAVIAKRSTGQGVGASVTVVTFESEEFDTANMFNPGDSSSKLTAPVKGVYFASATVAWDTSATGRRLVRMNRNAEPMSIATDSVQAASAGSTVQTLGRLVRLEAGDSITFDASHTAGGTLAITVQAASLNWVAP